MSSKLLSILLCVLVCGCAEVNNSGVYEKDTYNIKIITDTKVIDINTTITKGYKPSAFARDHLVIYSGFDNGEIIVPATATCIIQKLIKLEDSTNLSEPMKSQLRNNNVQ